MQLEKHTQNKEIKLIRRLQLRTLHVAGKHLSMNTHTNTHTQMWKPALMTFTIRSRSDCGWDVSLRNSRSINLLDPELLRE